MHNISLYKLWESQNYSPMLMHSKKYGFFMGHEWTNSPASGEKNNLVQTLRIIPYCKMSPKDNILLWQNAESLTFVPLPQFLSKKASGCKVGTDHVTLQRKGRRIPRCISLGAFWILAGTSSVRQVLPAPWTEAAAVQLAVFFLLGQ